ncbi:Ethanolamine-phosphate cytidylyltransferase [Podila epicladia]|nr:Ethanolamine-phosphate cytidylyltransferase [Podila epicladia]KAG0095899.1 Ethanolamine-phosphate cytidylyltransferase [Podila epicladia]
MMHYGHYNALRQARAMGGVIIAGIHSDGEIANHKGPSVMTETERIAAVSACRWVDELVLDAPYQTSLDWITYYHCDICVHGDDASTLANGTDSFALVKQAGRYRECQRTAGVSTTDLVGRLLLLTRDHHQHANANRTEVEASKVQRTAGNVTESSFTEQQREMVALFSSSLQEPEIGKKVVYVDGDFDLFHIGHTEILKRAKQELGGYVVVGIHDDATVNLVKGSNFPIMNLYERVLAVLSCRFVDKVVIGAPFALDNSILDHINVVVHSPSHSLGAVDSEYGLDRYQLAKERGLYTEIRNEETQVTTASIILRIMDHRKL